MKFLNVEKSSTAYKISVKYDLFSVILILM